MDLALKVLVGGVGLDRTVVGFDPAGNPALCTMSVIQSVCTVSELAGVGMFATKVWMRGGSEVCGPR